MENHESPNEEIAKLQRRFEISDEDLALIRDKKIIMADDTLDLNGDIKFLSILTEGKAEGIIVSSYLFKNTDILAETIFSKNPDVVILDNRMSLDHGDDGPYVTKKLRKLGFSGLIIGHSGSTNAPTLFKEAGADNFLEKDLDPQDFFEFLISIIKKHKK